MRISRWCYLTIAAALVAAFVAPATASALLTNSYGQQFAGVAACRQCHQLVYNQTSHGLFATATADPADSSAPGTGMWPAGRIEGGQSINATEVAFTLGSGTGLREYLADGPAVLGSVPATWGPVIMANGVEWDPREPFDFEYNLNSQDEASNGITFGAYTCSQCHQLGAVRFGVKPAAGNFAGASPGTMNGWAIPSGADPNLSSSYIPGSSIQCERCHGTGIAATVDNRGHWSSGVEIVGYNTTETFGLARAQSFKILDSQVCGQCHGSFKGGNIVGFTPDATITDFVTPYALSDVPTPAGFNRATSKFWPNSVNGLGQSRGGLGGQGNLKHTYYTEWAMSGHSWRGALTSTSPNATPYQKTVAKHFNMHTGGAQQLLCDRCHTGEGYLKRKLEVDTPVGLGNIMSTIPETVTAQGQLGQECADCHIAHGAENLPGSDAATDNAGAEANNVEVGMSVRPPEKANGQYSTFGLSTGNASVCEDCHNWQVEVLSDKGTRNATPPLASIGGTYVTHPQREIYHGQKMLEIPSAGVFMSSKDGTKIAKCEQCHMPATWSDNGTSATATALDRYTDRNAKRYSHRMFIMMPGDAKAWGLAPWGDSCSPCHAAETQDSLQADIDTWQSAAVSLAQQATSTINAAVTRGDNTAAGDLDLLQRASTNVSLYQQDGSFGVHNPEYEQAGLSKAVQLASYAGASLSMNVPHTVGRNTLFGVAGQALKGDGSAASGVTVTLWEGATLRGTAITDVNGNYSFAWATSVAGIHTFTVKWQRDSQVVTTLSATSSVHVELIPTILTLSRNHSAVNRGVHVLLSGELHPDVGGVTVQIQYKRPGSTVWRKLINRTTNSDGRYSYSFSTRTRGTWQFRSYFAGNSTYIHDYSPTAKVVVR